MEEDKGSSSPSIMGGDSSPLTEEASEPTDDPTAEALLALEATVFFVSLPSAARFAWRAAFDAETMVGEGVAVKESVGRDESENSATTATRW